MPPWSHAIGHIGVVQHLGDAVGQGHVVAGLEQHPGAGALDDLGQTTRASDDGRRAGRHALERDDPERFVQRRDHDAAGALQQALQLVVRHETGELNEVADALHVDLGLELGEVAAAAGDHATDAREAVPQVTDRSGQHLEALLVLDASPGDDQLLAAIVVRGAR